MKKLFSILAVVALSTACTKETVKDTVITTTFSVEDTYQSLMGEWKLTNYKEHMTNWKGSYESFVVSRTHFKGMPYEVIGEDKIKVNDTTIIEMLFTLDTTYVFYPQNGRQEKWAN